MNFVKVSLEDANHSHVRVATTVSSAASPPPLPRAILYERFRTDKKLEVIRRYWLSDDMDGHRHHRADVVYIDAPLPSPQMIREDMLEHAVIYWDLLPLVPYNLGDALTELEALQIAATDVALFAQHCSLLTEHTPRVALLTAARLMSCRPRPIGPTPCRADWGDLVKPGNEALVTRARMAEGQLVPAAIVLDGDDYLALSGMVKAPTPRESLGLVAAARADADAAKAMGALLGPALGFRQRHRRLRMLPWPREDPLAEHALGVMLTYWPPATIPIDTAAYESQVRWYMETGGPENAHHLALALFHGLLGFAVDRFTMQEVWGGSNSGGGSDPWDDEILQAIWQWLEDCALPTILL